MTTDSQDSNKPPPLVFDYRAEGLRILVTASHATREAEWAEQCLAAAERALEATRGEGDATRVPHRERVVQAVRQQAAIARKHADDAERAAKHYEETMPDTDTFEARTRTRNVFQGVLYNCRQAKTHCEEASRLSGLKFAGH